MFAVANLLVVFTVYFDLCSYLFVSFMRNAYMNSAYLLSRDGWLAGWLSQSDIVSKRLNLF